MSITYEKKDENTLIVTETITHIIEEDRIEIQTRIDHLEIDIVKLQNKIDTEIEKITILDEEE